jgi:hypothetical protein
MSPEKWIELLYIYGPFALAVLLLLVAEKKAREVWQNAPADGRPKLLMLYLANWLAFFGLIGFDVMAWARINLREEYTIKGTFE